MTKTRFLRTILITVTGLALAGIIAVYQIKNETMQTGIVAENFGGAFTLTDHTGKQVTDKDFENRYRLIYFGFTYCPAICPTELQRISTIINKLGSAGEKIQPVFITVDPERDSVDVMKNYVAQFHPQLVGLTGTPEQITTVKKAYKIYAAKVQEATMSDYTVDHSSYIYFMGPDNSLIRIFKTDDTIDDIIKVIEQYI